MAERTDSWRVARERLFCRTGFQMLQCDFFIRRLDWAVSGRFVRFVSCHHCGEARSQPKWTTIHDYLSCDREQVIRGKTCTQREEASKVREANLFRTGTESYDSRPPWASISSRLVVVMILHDAPFDLAKTWCRCDARRLMLRYSFESSPAMSAGICSRASVNHTHAMATKSWPRRRADMCRCTSHKLHGITRRGWKGEKIGAHTDAGKAGLIQQTPCFWSCWIHDPLECR